MSSKILQALMQLFAVIAKVENHEPNEGDASIITKLLERQLNAALVEEYLALYFQHLEKFRKRNIASSSTKVLRICSEINKEQQLSQKERVIIIVRLFEFIYSNGGAVSKVELEFVDLVAGAFKVDPNEYEAIKEFVSDDAEKADNHLILHIHSGDKSYKHAEEIILEGIHDQLLIINIPSAQTLFLKSNGIQEVYLNNQLINSNFIQTLNPGSSIRVSKLQTIYFSTIQGKFMANPDEEQILFNVENIEYQFKKGKIGLHDFSFSGRSGKMVGIMGGSGSGKSTLLNVLNGNNKPTKGRVIINGYDIHKEKKSIEGLIGYVAQDDLLFEELTVFQNLFYNAKLCFGNLDEPAIIEKVNETLRSLGLYETRNLHVGSPLDKTISGGQRKRLNIALELIREPSVLFVDEPTSGLSSRDSENIMDLLKQLALKGKLVFVVIHQPSSDIFKMFDDLLILDQGGYPVYKGNPVESIVYFKTIIGHANCEESECPTCGNVNPEQIFNIIESNIVDEEGNFTELRKKSAEDWNAIYTKKIGDPERPFENKKTKLPTNIFKVPNKLKQFIIFVIRDVLTKLSNKQYMIINSLEAPLLAIFLAWFLRYVETGGEADAVYNFRLNENIPVFIFMAVIVAIFIGLTVSAEEIIRDKKVLTRESFLNLSKGSYLFAKIFVLFVISLIQTLSFVVLGNLILGIDGMILPYWIVLFSASAFANILGLNISASLKSIKVIYIIIPIIIIPQLLFSGVIVKFDKLNPLFASQDGVPWIGNIMTSRWAYEALAVNQFVNNDYEKQFFALESRLKSANYKKGSWKDAVLNHLRNAKREIAKEERSEEENKKLAYDLLIVRNALIKESAFLNLAFDDAGLYPETFSEAKYNETKKILDKITKHYNRIYNSNNKKKDKIIIGLEESKGKENFIAFKDAYSNDNLNSFLTNSNTTTFIQEYKGQLIPKKDYVYLRPYGSSFINSHFYSPYKRIFGNWVPTLWANVLVIWVLTLLFGITLFTDAFNKIGKWIYHKTAR